MPYYFDFMFDVPNRNTFIIPHPFFFFNEYCCFYHCIYFSFQNLVSCQKCCLCTFRILYLLLLLKWPHQRDRRNDKSWVRIDDGSRERGQRKVEREVLTLGGEEDEEQHLEKRKNSDGKRPHRINVCVIANHIRLPACLFLLLWEETSTQMPIFPVL